MLGLVPLLSESLPGTVSYYDTRKFSDEIGVPVLASKFAVGYDRKADVFLHSHDFADRGVFNFPKGCSIDLPVLKIRTRRMH